MALRRSHDTIWLGSFIVTALCVALAAACGSDDDDTIGGGGSGAPTTTTTTTTTSTASTTSTTGAGGDDATTTVQQVAYLNCGEGGSSCSVLVLDSSGRVLSSTAYAGACGSSQCAEQNTFTYGAGPQPLTVAVDRNCDGSIDWSYAYTYDSSGLMATMGVDSDGDGTLDGTACVSNETVGDELIERRDFDCDGSVEHCRALTYDADGNLLTERTLEAPGCYGGSDCRSYGYDATGSRIWYSYDSACDGDEDTRWCYSYFY